MDLLAAQMAYDAGAKILLLTDKASSPLAQYATQLLTISVDSNTFFNSYVSVVFACELLCSFISRKVGYSNEDKLKKIDKYLSKSWTILTKKDIENKNFSMSFYYFINRQYLYPIL